MSVNIILGPPGTGKTTKLLSIMEKALQAGVSIENIAFISFTKRAIKEARDRVKKKFNLQNSDIKHFRTLHSFAFQQLGLSSKHLMRKENYHELAEMLGIELAGMNTLDLLEEIDFITTVLPGDRMLFLDGVARNKQMHIKNIWEKFVNDDLDYFQLEQVSEGLRRYKQMYSLMDYTDILEYFLHADFLQKFDLLLIDETQDLSALQWAVVNKIKDNAKEIYIAGDDDQSIFRWAGADIETFIGLEGDVTVLDTSYRLPKQVHEFSKKIVSRIGYRRQKEYYSNSTEGSVSYINDIDQLNLANGSWLILARSGYTLRPYLEYIWDMKMFYAFKDKGLDNCLACQTIKSYIRIQNGQMIDKKALKVMHAYMSNTDEITKPWHEALDLMPSERKLLFMQFEKEGENFFTPRIIFSTIHGAKGAEADNVVISPDLSYKAYNEMLENPDDEARVFYVGITRAKQNLFILTPQTRYYYEL